MNEFKRFLMICGVCASIVFILLVLFLEAELHIKIILGLFIGACMGTYLDNLFYRKTSSKKTAKSRKKSAPKTDAPKPIYIRKAFDNNFCYRVECHHGKQYVFEGFSNKYIYRIEGDRIYRGSETKVYYQLKGNKIYRAFDYKNPVYRIEDDKIYQGSFGTKPVFTIGNRAVR